MTMTAPRTPLLQWEQDLLDRARRDHQPPVGDLEWGTPPPPAGAVTTSKRWDDVAARLRARPGEWAKIATMPTSNLVTYVRRGKYAAFRPSGSFDATARSVKTDDGTVYDVWATFLDVPESGE